MPNMLFAHAGQSCVDHVWWGLYPRKNQHQWLKWGCGACLSTVGILSNSNLPVFYEFENYEFLYAKTLFAVIFIFPVIFHLFQCNFFHDNCSLHFDYFFIFCLHYLLSCVYLHDFSCLDVLHMSCPPVTLDCHFGSMVNVNCFVSLMYCITLTSFL